VHLLERHRGHGRRHLDSLADRDGVLTDAPRAVEWHYADGRTNDAQVRDREVDREVARLYAARVRKEAAMLNRQRDFAAADQVVAGVARRIRAYAGDDPELRRLVEELARERVQVSAPMPAMALKEMHYQSSYAQRGRDVQGRARKGAEDRPRSAERPLR